MYHMITKATDRILFDGDDDVVVTEQIMTDVSVKCIGELVPVILHRKSIAECIWINRKTLHFTSERGFRWTLMETPVEIGMEIGDTQKLGCFKRAGPIMGNWL